MPAQPWCAGSQNDDQGPFGTPLSPAGNVLIVEFEPVQARLVQRDATRTLWVGLAAAMVLLVVTAFFWRTLGRLQAAEAERQRRRRLAALGEMSAVLAHEIRNPLTSLKGHAQLLVEVLAPDSRAKKKADRVVAEAERLEGISSDLLDFVRTGPLDRRSHSPAELVRATAAELGEQRFELLLDRAPDTWSLDSGRLRQVLVNLMRNALQASPDGQAVTVTVKRRDGALRIEVRDHGTGVPAQERERIFEPFVAGRTRGTGLGLAVSRRLVEMHGGTLTADNAPDGGALVLATIPQEE